MSKVNNINKEERTRYVSGQVDKPADTHGTGCSTTNKDDGILASINEATKGHRASHDALAAVNADDGVWVTHDFVDNLSRALTISSKVLETLAYHVKHPDSKNADKMNDCSTDVTYIAMSLTLATTNSNNSCIGGTWLNRRYLKHLKQSIDGNANAVGTIAIIAQLTSTYMHRGVRAESVQLTEIGKSIGELLAHD